MGFLVDLNGIFTGFENHVRIVVTFFFAGIGWGVIFRLIGHFYPKFYALYENYHTFDTG